MSPNVPKLAIAVIVVAAALSLCSSAGRAQTYGEKPWCAVLNLGTGDVVWQCEYRTVEECVPNVLGGNRGSCNLNPYYRPAPQAPAHMATPHRHRRHYAERN